MGIRYSVSSEFSDYEADGWVPENQIGFWPDVHTGRIIVAKSLGDQKADVGVATGHFMGEEMPDSVAYELMSRAYLRRRLEVWGNMRLPVILPEGELGFIKLIARPVIWLSLHRQTDPSSEDYLR